MNFDELVSELRTFALRAERTCAWCLRCDCFHPVPGRSIDVLWYRGTPAEHLESCCILAVREHDAGVPPGCIRVYSQRHAGAYNLPLAARDVVDSYPRVEERRP